MIKITNTITGQVLYYSAIGAILSDNLRNDIKISKTHWSRIVKGRGYPFTLGSWTVEKTEETPVLSLAIIRAENKAISENAQILQRMANGAQISGSITSGVLGVYPANVECSKEINLLALQIFREKINGNFTDRFINDVEVFDKKGNIIYENTKKLFGESRKADNE